MHIDILLRTPRLHSEEIGNYFACFARIKFAYSTARSQRLQAITILFNATAATIATSNAILLNVLSPCFFIASVSAVRPRVVGHAP